MRSIYPFLLLFLSLSASAFTVPKFVPNVVDQTGTFSETQISDINQEIDKAQKKGILTGVLFVSTLNGESIEDVAEKVFKEWELGEKGKDNGILILVATQDRQMRIEVGYGLEGKITDAEAGEIIHRILKPNFKEGNYSSGVMEAIQRMSLVASGEFEPYSNPESEFSVSPKFVDRATWWIGLFLLLPALIGTFGLITASILKAKGLELLKKKKEKVSWRALGISSRGGLAVKAFLFINPGIFITLFPVVFEGEREVTFIMNTGFIICVFFANLVAIFLTLDLFSEKRVQKKLARTRLNHLRSKRVAGSTYTLFGQTYTTPRSSSSSSGWSSGSSSSSSSRSSSSSGGRSGGGGASGSW